MSKKSFSEKLIDIVSTAKSKTKDGKMKSSFSKRMYCDVLNAMVNDSDYVLNTVQTKGDGVVELQSQPVKLFREKLLAPILAEVKMDSADAAKFIENYEFSKGQTDPMYDLFTAATYEYMNTGKTFRFHNKEDFSGAISLRDNEESIFENKLSGKKVKRKAHKTIIKKSSCPAWKKEVIDAGN